MSKKILSLLLAIIMILGMFPTTALAAGSDKKPDPTVNISYNQGDYTFYDSRKSPDNITLSGKVKNVIVKKPVRNSENSNNFDITICTANNGSAITSYIDTIVPKEGYTISKIQYKTGDSNYTDITKDETFDGNVTITFKVICELVTPAATTVNVTFNKNGGDTEANPSSITETIGGKYTLPTTSPTKEGSTFAGWFTTEVDGDKVTAETTVTKDIDHTLYAHWIAQAATTYTITNGTPGTANGTITLPESAAAGETVTVTSNTPNDGYKFKTITVVDADSNPVEVTNNNSFVMPESNVTVTAVFAKIRNITDGTAQNANGTITINPTTAIEDETVTVTVAPNDGYELETLVYKCGENTGSISLTTDGYCFVMPEGENDVTVTATFSEKQGETEKYKVINARTEVTKSSQKGYITIDKPNAAKDETVTVTVFPLTVEQGKAYHLHKLYYTTEGNEGTQIAITTRINTNTFKFTMPAANVTVTADFKRDGNENTAVAVPTAVTELVYNGQPQTGVEAGLGYTLTDNTATNADDYTATATLESGYKWSDDSTGAKEIKWSIAKATYDMSGVTFADKIETYNGSEKSVTISGTLPTGVQVSYTNNTGTNAGTYNATATFTGDSTNYEAIESKTATLTINPANAAVEPTPATNLTYNGKSWSCHTDSGTGTNVTLSGDLTKTDAGDYQFTATPNTNYAWSDGGTDTKTYKWSIAKAPLTATAQSFTVAYGDPIPDYYVSYEGWVTEDAEVPTTSAVLTSNYKNTSPVDTYPITFSTVPEFTNYSVTTVNGVVTVNRANTAVEPSKTDRIYNGESQNGYTSVGTNVDLSGTYAATDVGTYQFTATPKTNYAWSDESTTAKTYSWNIEAATIDTATAASQKYTSSALTPDLTVKAGNLDAAYDISDWSGALTNAGTYTATVTGKGNFKGSLTVSFTIEPASVTEATADSQEYTGSALTPVLAVKAGDLDATTYDISAWSDALVEPGTYTATVTGNGNFTGTADVEFTITHTHHLVKVDGKTPTISAAGWNDYYECKDAVSPTTSCHKYFEDEKGTTPIANLDTWKAENGAGYIPKLPCIRGRVQQATESDPTNVSEATVKLFPKILGVAETTTDENGNYYFYDIPAGTYDIVVTKGDKTITKMVTFTAAGPMNDVDIVFPIKTVNSEVVHTGTEITNTKSNILDTVVGGLDKIAEEAVVEGKTVTIKLKVEPETYSGTYEQKAINKLAGEGKKVEFIDLKLTKQVNETITDIGDSNDKLLTIVIPFDFSDVKVNSITVLRNHKGTTIRMTKDPEEGEEGFFIEEAAGTITIRAKTFSTYAISFDDNSYVPARKGSSNVITIGNRKHTEEETNPDTGAPVMSMSTGMVLLAGIALILSKRR